MKYNWTFKDTKFTKDKGKVFSTFACGGGSTMGYKLAGFDVIGCEDIDPKMIEVYKANHNPKYAYLEDIRTFKERDDLPEELFNLDILDGSPPCSSFSMAGNREDDWGKEKVFREGQKKQTLDDLFFDFIDLTKKLQPKVVIAENVKGMLIGEAVKYVQKIIKGFEEAGYDVEHWLLKASNMGVPQARERVFFIGIRKDIAKKIPGQRQTMFSGMPYLNLEFNEPEITYGDIEEKEGNQNAYGIAPGVKIYWEQIKPGQNCSEVHPKGHYFQEIKLSPKKPLPTLRAGSNSYYHYEVERKLFTNEIIKGSSFPLDYNFLKLQPIYVCGMSVPPLMVAKIAQRIHEQWLSKLL